MDSNKKKVAKGSKLNLIPHLSTQKEVKKRIGGNKVSSYFLARRYIRIEEPIVKRIVISRSRRRLFKTAKGWVIKLTKGTRKKVKFFA
jgi:hypothetical protein